MDAQKMDKGWTEDRYLLSQYFRNISLHVRV